MGICWSLLKPRSNEIPISSPSHTHNLPDDQRAYHPFSSKFDPQKPHADGSILGKGYVDLKATYHIGKELGRGQFGITYLCTEKATGLKYACKSISKRKLVTTKEMEDVRREIMLMQHLTGQPNIVEFKGAYEDEISVHLVMELCSGGELFDRITKRGSYSEKEAAKIGRQIVNVVHACHFMGVMHRDLKPENFLMVSQDEEAPLKATDLGLSVFIEQGDDEEEITRLKARLFEEFEMKDLGRLKYFLGIEVMRSRKGIFICQKKYILDLLAETGMIDCKPVNTPMMMNQKLYMEENAKLADKGEYQRIVGKLIYLSHTRPDIAYAVGVVSQFMHQPQVTHMEAVWRIIRYLKGTPGHGVLFKTNGHLEAHIYTDADWAGDKGNRRSTSGYFALVGGNLVTWRSKKQKVVALSSAEAEFRGIARGLAEILWIRKLLTEIGYPPPQSSKILCDNKAAIQISENPVQHDRTKHIEVDRHFIKEKLEAGIIDLPFVRSENQLADILTKAVSEKIFNHCLGKLNIGNSTTQLEGEC